MLRYQIEIQPYFTAGYHVSLYSIGLKKTVGCTNTAENGY